MAADEADNGDDEEITDDPEIVAATTNGMRTEADYRERAAKAYAAYSSSFKNRFKWLPSTLFVKALSNDLQADALALLDVLKQCGDWNPEHDAKLAELAKLISKKHGNEKLLIFTQFADTARYLKDQ